MGFGIAIGDACSSDPKLVSPFCTCDSSPLPPSVATLRGLGRECAPGWDLMEALLEESLRVDFGRIVAGSRRPGVVAPASTFFNALVTALIFFLPFYDDGIRNISK